MRCVAATLGASPPKPPPPGPPGPPGPSPPRPPPCCCPPSGAPAEKSPPAVAPRPTLPFMTKASEEEAPLLSGAIFPGEVPAVSPPVCSSLWRMASCVPLGNCPRRGVCGAVALDGFFVSCGFEGAGLFGPDGGGCDVEG